MDTEKIIDEYIDKEKQVSYSPALHGKLMQQINSKRLTRKISLLHSVSAAASIIITIASGILMGNSYNFSEREEYKTLTINDYQLENFILLIDDETE